jgi:hypothetical protein
MSKTFASDSESDMEEIEEPEIMIQEETPAK